MSQGLLIMNGRLWGSKTPVWLCDLGVFVDQATEDFPASDPCLLDVDHAGAGFWWALLERSVGAVLVVMLGVFGEHDPVRCHNSSMASDLAFYPQHSCSYASCTC